MTEKNPAETPRAGRPKVAVVIGGGGLKSLAAIPLFELLTEAKIEVDLLVGCSGGGIMAACWGAGYEPQEMRTLITEHLNKKLFRNNVDYRSILGIAKMPFGRFHASSGILKREPFRRVYQRIFGDLLLEDLHPETLLQVTDFETGDGVVFNSGLVADAVYASTALFPMLPPMKIDGRWYVDGAYSSNVPVLEAVKRNMDVIIAVVLNEKLTQLPEGFLECFYTIQKTSTRSLVRSQLSLSVDLHHHEIIIINVSFDKYVQIWDVEDVPEILETGRRAVEREREEIFLALANARVAGDQPK
jgi:NTE family protein